jgi:anti-sigma-K factor RskA
MPGRDRHGAPRPVSLAVVRRRRGPGPATGLCELWVISGREAPVPASVLDVDARGVGSIRFEPSRVAGDADTFPATLEPAGGMPTSSGSMFLLVGL